MSTAPRTRASSGSFSSAENRASGRVRVRPCRLPAKVMVAPNSPSARAQARTRPAMSEGSASGRRTRTSRVHGEAPRVLAASSCRGSTARRPASEATTRKGSATKVWASTTAAAVNGSCTSRGAVTRPARPKASSSASPPTTGGSTMGRVTRRRAAARRGPAPPASHAARGSPSAAASTAAPSEVPTESSRVSFTSGRAMAAGRVSHGTRSSRAARGSARRATPKATSGASRSGSRVMSGDPRTRDGPGCAAPRAC